MLSTRMLPTTFAPVGTIRTGARRSDPMCGLSAWTIPPLEIAHTAFVIGRFDGLMPDCGAVPRPPAAPNGGVGLSGVFRVMAVSPPGHVGELFAVGVAVFSF